MKDEIKISNDGTCIYLDTKIKTSGLIRSIIPFLFLFIAVTSYGQSSIYEVDSVATALGEQLIKNKRATTVFIYQTGCIGCETIDGCECEEGSVEVYLFVYGEEQSIKKLTCCSVYEAKKFDSAALMKKILSMQDEIFNSEFKYDYIEVHHNFYKLKLITKDTIRTINISSVLFNEDYKYRTHNLNQSAAKLLKDIWPVIRKAEQSPWTLE